MSAPIADVARLLGSVQTAVHFRYPVDLLPGLRVAALDAGAFLAEISFKAPADLRDLFDRIGRALQFPELGQSWQGVMDWATDLDFIENEVGFVIVLRDVDGLAGFSADDRNAVLGLWLNGPKGFQFEDRVYHVVMAGEYPSAADMLAAAEEWIPLFRWPLERILELGGKTDRIPVFDWDSGAPVLIAD